MKGRLHAAVAAAGLAVAAATLGLSNFGATMQRGANAAQQLNEPLRFGFTPGPLQRTPSPHGQFASAIAGGRGYGTGGVGGVRKRPPWTNARYRRAAAKSRNVQRNRRAHRG